MGTYAKLVKEGKITNPKDFVNLCLKNFNILNFVDSDDDILNIEDFTEIIRKEYQEKVDWAKKMLNSSVDKLSEFMRKSDNELYDDFRKEISDKKKTLEGQISDISESNANLSRMADRIQRWNCSEDIHNIKEFCMSQLQSSMENTKFYEECLRNLENKTFAEYKSSMQESLIEDINYWKSRMNLDEMNLDNALDLYEAIKKDLKKL